MVFVLQFLLVPPDRQAAKAVHYRIDTPWAWKLDGEATPFRTLAAFQDFLAQHEIPHLKSWRAAGSRS